MACSINIVFTYKKNPSLTNNTDIVIEMKDISLLASKKVSDFVGVTN